MAKGEARNLITKLDSPSTNSLLYYDGTDWTNGDVNGLIAGTANQVIVTDDLDGTLTLSTPQDIHTSASPTFSTLDLTVTDSADAIGMMMLENTSSTSARYPGFSVYNYEGGVGGHGYCGQYLASGTKDVPGVAPADRNIGAYPFSAHNGTTFVETARISARTETTFDATHNDSAIVFYTATGAGGITERMRIKGDGTLQLGGSTNYTKVTSSGHVTFEGTATVWNDIQFEVSSGKVGAANIPTWEALTTNIYEYSFDVDDYIDLNSEEVSHGWKEGTAGNMHVHLSIPDANGTGSSRYAKFTLYIAYVNSSGIWTETSLTAEQEIPDGSSALENFYLDMGDLTLTGLTIGTQIKCRIKRIAATGGTEYASNVFVHQVGCHLEEDRVGSNTEAAS